MSETGRDITDRIALRCGELGFALSGICAASPTDYKRELLEWLAAGKHGEMSYLQRNLELRIDPRVMVPGARSIICVADRYAADTPEPECAPRRDDSADTDRQAMGRIARYARGDDYHVAMKRRLHDLSGELEMMFPHEVFRVCVDTAPVLEREHAQRAGLGAVGKNTLLIERGVGSYLLLGEILTTMALAPSTAAAADPCSGCTRCIDACPTDAISPWSVDATRCISYLTIEHRGLIDVQLHRAMDDWVFGCDICQEVCPHNQGTARSEPVRATIHPAYAPRRHSLALLELLNWSEQARRDSFTKSSMKRATLGMMKRNALIAAGNALRTHPDAVLWSRIKQIAADEAEPVMVRQTAQQVLSMLPESGCANSTG